MKKVLLVHGFEGSPNGGWRPWLMAELEKQDIYACALPMPNPAEPICEEWVGELERYVDANSNDEIYLVGHSLGTPAILRYLELPNAPKISGAVLVSGPIDIVLNKKISSFLDKEFDFKTIKTKADKFCVIHGDNDPNVPLDNAEKLAKELECELIVVKNGGHLNGSIGWTKLPHALEALNRMFEK